MTHPDVFSPMVIYPHEELHTGNLVVGAGSILDIHCFIDLTGSITFGQYCMVGRGVKIYTHDHYHEGTKPLLLLQKEKGIKWKDKIVGNDVWFHECIILYQVTEIPDGCVFGAGSVVTRNPVQEYGIYAGNPAVLIGVR